MANGEMLAELKRILAGEMKIPDNVTNRMILAGLIEVYAIVEKFGDNQVSIVNRIGALESRPVPQCALLHEQLKADIEKDSRKENEKFISFPYIWEHYGEKIVWFLIAAALGAMLARIF